jgi:hypothetical protein
MARELRAWVCGISTWFQHLLAEAQQQVQQQVLQVQQVLQEGR